jgi:beta-glucanase (GH16 family)
MRLTLWAMKLRFDLAGKSKNPNDEPAVLPMKINPARLLICVSLLWPGLMAPAFASPPPGYKLVWFDEFKGHSLDTNKWDYWLTGHRRSAVNATNAVSVTHGHVTITSYTQDGKQYTGMISSEGKFAPVHGYWEARIRYEDSPGMWSAFWLQSPTMGHPIGDTATAGIEIDICEHRVIDTGGTNLAAQVQHTLHWDGYGRYHKSKGHLTGDMKLDRGFHVYGCEVTTNGYQFYVDNQPTWTVREAVSNAREFVILSSEIDDHAWASHIPAAGYGDLKHSKTRMTVDYVRYYSRE